ncbi:MAG: thioredoxin family protein [Bacillus sp. (in: Bacteria)]|nr:thioredoxin family protein [Bacillus sp. (in: firmicutes)]
MELNEWFQKGMTADKYIGSMTQNKGEMQAIFEQFSLTAADKSKLTTLRPQELRAIVLSEDWCGDALLNNPILLRIAESVGMEVRFVLRDQNLELMDHYLTNGVARAIPIFIFIDQEGNEVGVWGPRAPEIQVLLETRREALPEKNAEDFQEKQMEMYKQLVSSYMKDETIWQSVKGSIMAKLL